MSTGQTPDLPKPTQDATGDSPRGVHKEVAKTHPSAVPPEVSAAHAAGGPSEAIRALAGAIEQPKQSQPSQRENATPDRIADLDTMLRTIHKGTRSGQLDVKVGNTAVTLGYKDALGNGGSKSVRRIVLDGQEYALGLPNPTDSAATMLEKWDNVQREPANTDRMRELGFLTNPVCQLVPIEINGVPFQAVLMTPYHKLPYEVRDGKTAREGIDPATGLPKPELHDLFPPTLDAATFRETMQGVVQDVANLARHGVRLPLDSFNIAIVDGKMRLYFADLGSARFEEPSPADNQDATCKLYIRDAIRTVLGVMSTSEQRAHGSFFDGKDFASDTARNIYDELTSDAMLLLRR